MFGKHSGLLPVRSAASEDLWRERAHELLTSRLPCELRAPCCHPMVLARLLLFVALWHTVEGGSAVGVEAAFLLLAGMQSGLSLVFLWLAVWVVVFVVGDVVDVRGVYSSSAFFDFAPLLDDHSQHPLLSCPEFSCSFPMSSFLCLNRGGEMV